MIDVGPFQNFLLPFILVHVKSKTSCQKKLYKLRIEKCSVDRAVSLKNSLYMSCDSEKATAQFE